jgi:hypothetical protein
MELELAKAVNDAVLEELKATLWENPYRSPDGEDDYYECLLDVLRNCTDLIGEAHPTWRRLTYSEWFGLRDAALQRRLAENEP